jgi:hypothetical protein
MVERTKSHTTETIPRSFSETSRPFLDPGTVDQLADVGSAFMCEAVLRVDVVVRRASLPSIFPARASWSRAFPSPPLVVVHLASLAWFISFWLPFAVGHEGERGDARGGGVGGRRRLARGGGARPTKTSAGKTAPGGATRGRVSHTNALLRRPSRLTDLTVPSSHSFEGAVSGQHRNRSVRGCRWFRPPPHFAHTKSRRSECRNHYHHLQN